MCIVLIHLGHHLLCGAACLASPRLLSCLSHLSWNRLIFFSTNRTTRPPVFYAVLIIRLANHKHYITCDSTALPDGGRLRRCCCLFSLLLSSDATHHHGSGSHVYEYTHYCTRDLLGGILGVGSVDGGWGIMVRGSEASISYGIQPVQIASMASLIPHPAPAPANLSISTVSPISLLYSTLLFFCGFLLILRSSDLSCPSAPVIYRLTTCSYPQHPCVLAFHWTLLANWELVPTGCTRS